MAKDAQHAQRSIITLTSPLEMAEPAAAKDAPRRFSILGYTGKKISAWWGDFVIDVNGIQTKPKIPILRDHDHGQIVGWADMVQKDDSGLTLSGTFSQTTIHGKDALALADEGFPWQASVGIRPLQVRILKDATETMIVNGQEMSGPLEILTKSLVGETSLVAWGADNDTGVKLLADKGENVSVEILQSQPETGEENMDIKQLQEKHPDLYQAVFALGAASIDAETARTDGIQTERARVVEILSEGADTDATVRAITDGMSVGDAYKLFFQAEKAKKAAAIGELAASADNSLGHVTPKDPDPVITDPAQEVSRLAVALSIKDKISLADATKMVLATDKKLSDAYYGQFNA